MGASLMVCLVDHVNADATKNVRGAYKRGDIVEVRPINGAWGAEERPPHVGRVDLVGTFDPAKVAKYIAEEHDTADGVPGADSSRVRRRLYRVDLTLLSAANLAKLETGRGTLTLSATGGDSTWDAGRFAIFNKKDGMSEGARGVTEGDLS